MTSDTELIEKLRHFVATLRRTPQPISEVIPYLIQAADRLESLSDAINEKGEHHS